jgi:histidine ammonia-lyase
VTLQLTGADLTLDDVVAVARGGERVELTESAVDAMRAAAALAARIAERGEPVYGLTTGLGVQKRTRQQQEDACFSRRQIAESRAGVGPLAPPDVVRAAMLVFANQMAGGTTCLRPVLAERLVAALNDGELPEIRSRGSIGASDLAQMSDLAAGVFGGVGLEQGEGLALINSSAFGTGSAALAVADAVRLADAADVAAALCLEGFAANLSVLHPAIERARPDPVLAATLQRFRGLLDGSPLWAEGAARNLQDPLNFRSSAPVQAAARRALEYAQRVMAIELNAAQGNPLVSVADGSILSASLYEMVGVSAALDFVRIAFAAMLLAASERAVKLMDTPWSGLPVGLQQSGSPDLGLSILAITAESLGAEVTTLAQPVSFIVTSTAGAEGIEDRASHLPLSARRLAELVDAGEDIIAIELLASAQAVDVRGAFPLGAGTAAAYEAVRKAVPVMSLGDTPPVDVAPVVDLIRSGAFS